MIQVIFNGLNLNDQVNYFVEESIHEQTAKAELNLQKIARSNESVLLRKGYGTKSITISVIITDTTTDLLDARLDGLKLLCEAMGKNLDISYASGTRRYVCTGFIESIDRKPRYAVMKIKFECYSAFGEDVSATTLAKNGKTVSPYADTIAIGGSAPAQPDITIKVNTFTGTGSRTIKMTNTDTGDYIQIDKSDWAANDIITINSKTMIVTKNGVAINYLGIMPIWEVGTIHWEYSDTFTARNVDINFSYKKKYL